MSDSSSSDLPYSDDDDDKPQWSGRASATTGTFGNSVKLTQFTRSNSVDRGMYQSVHHVDYHSILQYSPVYGSIPQYTVQTTVYSCWCHFK